MTRTRFVSAITTFAVAAAMIAATPAHADPEPVLSYNFNTPGIGKLASIHPEPVRPVDIGRLGSIHQEPVRPVDAIANLKGVTGFKGLKGAVGFKALKGAVGFKGATGVAAVR